MIQREAETTNLLYGEPLRQTLTIGAAGIIMGLVAIIIGTIQIAVDFWPRESVQILFLGIIFTMIGFIFTIIGARRYARDYRAIRQYALDADVKLRQIAESSHTTERTAPSRGLLNGLWRRLTGTEGLDYGNDYDGR